MKNEFRNALHKAMVNAIAEIGIEQFKKTSLFISNERSVSSAKVAA